MKEFYFIRHGQTNHNLLETNLIKGDHPDDIPLNATGRTQATSVAPLISSLPIQTICSSPLRRAQETKEIITANLQADHHEIPHLGECSSQIWKEMSTLGMYSPPPTDGPARKFIDQVKKGLDHAFSLPGPLLIVAHGGVHWAICCLLSVEEHHWAISNCVPVHFSQNSEKWSARKLV